jgi:hypothetical protein
VPEQERSQDWPKDAWALSKQLREIAPNLRAEGIDIGFQKSSGAGSRRIITITKRSKSKAKRAARRNQA